MCRSCQGTNPTSHWSLAIAGPHRLSPVSGGHWDGTNPLPVIMAVL
jgi:hypothetical protein